MRHSEVGYLGLILLVTILILILLSESQAYAQILYGSLTGSISDESGASVPGVEVQILDLDTNYSQSATSDDSGNYLLRNVPDGTYLLRASLPGFKEHVVEGVEVKIGNVTRENLVLRLGEIHESVTVRGTSGLLQTDTADLHSQLDTKELRDLPLQQFRNYQSLVDLVPGSTRGEFSNAIIDTPGRNLRRSVNGVYTETNSTRIDGALSVNIWLPHHSAYVPPSENIEVVNIATNNFDAEVGFAGGVAVTLVTKSGTNELHGSLFYHHENSLLNARDFFNFVDKDDDGRADKPSGRRHFWGYTVGGPIIRDKLFFFTGFEALQQARAGTVTSTLPTAAQRRGDFSEFLPLSAGGPCHPDGESSPQCTVIYDPLTGDAGGNGKVPFPNNIIPEDRMSSAALRMQALLPATNLPGLTSNHEISGQEVMNRFNTDAKIDWYRSNQHRFWGKFSWMDATVLQDPRFGEGGGRTNTNRSLPGEGLTDTRIYAAGHSWLLSPDFLVDGNFGFTDRNQEGLPLHFSKGNFGSDVLGIPGTNLAPGQERACIVDGVNRCAGVPYFNVQGFDEFGELRGLPYFRNENSLSFTHNVSWSIGSHEIRWGYDLVKHMLDHWQPETGPGGPRGGFLFNRNGTSLPGTVGTAQNSWASFLLGTPHNLVKSLQWELMTAREWQHAWYVRDRWQVNPELTFTLGLRYEFFPLVSREDRPMEYMDLSGTVPCQWGDCFEVVLDNDIDVSKKLFAPRVGFAYRLSNNDVLRAGYGITNSPIPFARPLRGFFPLTISSEFPSDTSFTPEQTLEEGIPLFTGPDTSPGARIPIAPFTDMRTMPADKITRGYIQSWNLTYERRLPSDFVVALAYVGTQTTHQLADRDLNWSARGQGNEGRQLYPMRTTITRFWDGWLSANYHALQATIDRRFSGDLFVKGAYTFGKAINMTNQEGWSGLRWNDPALLHRNRAQSRWSRPHTLQLATIYAPSWGQSQGVLSQLLRDWQFNTIFSVNSNQPGTIFGEHPRDSFGNLQTVDQVKAEVETLGGVGQGSPYLDATAFAQVSRVPGVDCVNFDCYGSTGRNIIRGPAWINLDLSLFRRFPIREGVQLEVRSEFFNLTNTPHFDFGHQSAWQSNFMEILATSSSAPERIIRFGLKLTF